MLCVNHVIRLQPHADDYVESVTYDKAFLPSMLKTPSLSAPC
jgi:hypothetical protein